MQKYVTIDLNAYESNLSIIRQWVGPHVKICVVMKSDAYGHGIDNLLDSTIRSNVDYIAAIDNSEFKRLSNKIQMTSSPIRLLRISPTTKSELIEAQTHNWQVEELIASLEHAQMISMTASEISKTLNRKIIIPMHISIETGIGVIGIRNINDIQQVICLPHLKLVGVMTHFSRAYETFPLDYRSVKTQYDIFNSIIKQLDLQDDIIQHIANTGATAKFPWTHKHMVRVGSLAYAEDLEKQENPNAILKPVMNGFYTKVSYIEYNVPPETFIGYNAKQKTRRDKSSTIALLRIGYNDGYSTFAFQHNATVLIREQRFPVIGKTFMNLLAVDITNQDTNNPVDVGDTVALVGIQGKEQITWDSFAKWNNTDVTNQILLIGHQITNKKLLS